MSVLLKCADARTAPDSTPALCWLRLTLAELAYSNGVKGSITLTLGVYMEKRLSMAQKRFTRSCETLTRVRKLSRNSVAIQYSRRRRTPG